MRVSKKLPLALDCWQSKYSQQIYNIHIFQFWVWLLRLLSMLFPKAPASCYKKKFGLIFAALYFYIYELKNFASDF